MLHENGEMKKVRFRDPSPKIIRDSEMQKSPENETSISGSNNASEISRSRQNFLTPTFLKVPFYTPSKGVTSCATDDSAESNLALQVSLL